MHMFKYNFLNLRCCLFIRCSLEFFLKRDFKTSICGFTCIQLMPLSATNQVCRIKLSFFCNKFEKFQEKNQEICFCWVSLDVSGLIEAGEFRQYSKNPYTRTFNFESQAVVGSYLMITNSNIRLLGSE